MIEPELLDHLMKVSVKLIHFEIIWDSDCDLINNSKINKKEGAIRDSNPGCYSVVDRCIDPYLTNSALELKVVLLGSHRGF